MTFISLKVIFIFFSTKSCRQQNLIQSQFQNDQLRHLHTLNYIEFHSPKPMNQIKSIIKEHQQVILHVFVWAIVFLMLILFDNDVKNGSPVSAREMEYINLNSITNFFWLSLFYLNTVILIPNLLYNKKMDIFSWN